MAIGQLHVFYHFYTKISMQIWIFSNTDKPEKKASDPLLGDKFALSLFFSYIMLNIINLRKKQGSVDSNRPYTSSDKGRKLLCPSRYIVFCQRMLQSPCQCLPLQYLIVLIVSVSICFHAVKHNSYGLWPKASNCDAVHIHLASVLYMIDLSSL